MSKPEFAWLVNDNTIRQVILTELGRIEDDDRLLEVASYICQHKLKTKPAVALIRRYQGTVKPFDPKQLVTALTKCIDDHMGRDYTFEEVRTALNAVADAVSLAENSHKPTKKKKGGA